MGELIVHSHQSSIGNSMKITRKDMSFLNIPSSSTLSLVASSSSKSSSSAEIKPFVENDKVRQKVIRENLNRVVKNILHEKDEKVNVKNEDEDEELDSEVDEIMNLAIITSNERKKERKLQKELEFRKNEANKDMNFFLQQQKDKLRDITRQHAEEIKEMENTLRKKQAEELNDLNKVHLQEREALKKKSQNGINTINSQLTGSKLSLEKAKKSMKRKVLEEEEDLVPECPVCMVEMLPPKQIFQCLEGHLVCSGCKPRLKNGCVTCRNKNGYGSRCRYLEDLVQKMMKTS